MNIQGKGEDGCDASHSNYQQTSGNLSEISGHLLLHPSQLSWIAEEVQQSRLLFCPCCTDTQDCAEHQSHLETVCISHDPTELTTC